MRSPKVQIVILLMLFCGPLLAQQPDWTWINPVPQGSSQSGSFYIESKNRFLIGTRIGKLHLTDDMGLTWNFIDLGSEFTCQKIKFFDGELGFLLGENGKVFRSTTGGMDWDESILDSTYTFYDVEKLDGKIFLVGGKSILPSGAGQVENFGALYVSTDSGFSWTKVLEAPGELYKGIAWVDGTTIVIRSAQMLLKAAIPTFVFNPISFPNPFFNDIADAEFHSPTIGFLALGGSLLRTENGGETWQLVSLPIQGFLGDISLQSDSVYIKTDSQILAGKINSNDWKTISTGGFEFSGLQLSPTGIFWGINDFYAEVILSTDFGQSWSRISRDVRSSIEPSDKYRINSINPVFPTPWIGYGPMTISRNGSASTIIAKTDDGGCSWREVPSFLGNPLYFLNDSVGFSSAGKKTINGGLTWIDCSFHPPLDSEPRSISFFNTSVGFLLTTDEDIYRTNDQGATWTRVRSSFAGSNFSQAESRSHSENRGTIAVGRSHYYLTHDQGRTWLRVTGFGSENVNSLFFLNDNLGYATGGLNSVGGFIWKSIDGGLTWAVAHQMPDELVSINFSNHDTGFISGQTGQFYTTTNSGASWTLQRKFSERPYRITLFENGVKFLTGFGPHLIKAPIKPTSNFAIASEVCAGVSFKPANLSKDARIFNWSINGRKASSQADPEFVITDPGTYLIELISSSCGDTDTATRVLTVLPLPEPKIMLDGSLLSSDTTLCNKSRALLSLSTPFVSQLWSLENITLPEIEIDASSEIWVEVTDLKGCKKRSDTVTVTFQVSPVARFSYSSNQGVVSFSNESQNYNSSLWNFGDGNTSDLQNPLHEYLTDGRFDIRLTVENECGIAETSKAIDIVIVGLLNNQIDCVVFPNPSNGEFFLPRDLNILRLSVFDPLGREVKLKQNGVNQFILELDSISGFLLFKIWTINGVTATKVLIKK